MSAPQSPEPAEPTPVTNATEASEPIELTKPTAPAGPAVEEVPAAPGAGRRFRRSVRLPERRGARWVLAAAAVVVVGAAAVGAGAALERHHEHSGPVFGRAFDVRGPVKAVGVPLAPGGPDVPGMVVREADGTVRFVPGAGKEGKLVKEGGGLNGSGVLLPDGSSAVVSGVSPRALAPAPLPAVPADQAVAKAAAAVPNGKVAALAVVAREGGGSAWSVEVLGPDGVRHLVTVDGTDGSITGNTVDGR